MKSSKWNIVNAIGIVSKNLVLMQKYQFDHGAKIIYNNWVVPGSGAHFMILPTNIHTS